MRDPVPLVFNRGLKSWGFALASGRQEHTTLPRIPRGRAAPRLAAALSPLAWYEHRRIRGRGFLDHGLLKHSHCRRWGRLFQVKTQRRRRKGKPPMLPPESARLPQGRVHRGRECGHD